MREKIAKRCEDVIKTNIAKHGRWSYKFEEITEMPDFNAMSDDELLNMFEYIIRSECR